MADTHVNRLRCTVSAVASAGLGAFTISAASSGYRSFGTSQDGQTFTVLVTEGTAWEVNTGCTYTHSGTSLARGTLADSSTGSAITFTTAAVVTVVMAAAFGNLLQETLDLGLASVRSPSTGTQTLSAGVFTKITVMTDIVTNTNTWWDTTNHRYTPQRAGKYLIIAGMQMAPASLRTVEATIYKNGIVDTYGSVFQSSTALLPTVSAIVEANGSTDYFELYVYADGSIPTLAGTGRGSFKAIYLGP